MDPRTEKMLAEREQKAASIQPLLRDPARVLNDAKAWVKTHPLAARVGAVALVVALIAAYYVVVQLPALRREQLQVKARAADRLKAETVAREVAVDDCLAKATAAAEARRSNACKVRREPVDCALPARLTDQLQREEGEARNSCLTRFSFGAQ